MNNPWSSGSLIPDSLTPYGTTGAPALIVYNNILYCIRQGAGNDGSVWCATFDGSAWSPDTLILDGSNTYGTTGTPALAVYNNVLYCIGESRNNAGWVWCVTFDGATWSPDTLIPDSSNAYGTTGTPALIVYDSMLYCIRQGQSDSGWVWCATFNGSVWSPDSLIPDNSNAYGTSGTPALTLYNGMLYCIREGRGNDGSVWCATFDGYNWSPDTLILDSSYAYGTTGTPALAVYDNALYCIGQDQNNGGLVWCISYNGFSWSQETLIPTNTGGYGATGVPMLIVYNDVFYCIGGSQDNGGSVWCASFDGVNWNQAGFIPESSNVYGITGAPALIVYKDILYCIGESQDNGGSVWCASLNDAASGQNAVST